MTKHTLLITGATGGLGKHVVRVLHDMGYRICATTGSSSVPDEMSAYVEDVQQVDLTLEQETSAYLDALLLRHPTLEAAVLLTGGFAMGGFADTHGIDIDRQIALNFKTAYHLVRPLMAHFANRGGGQFILVGARPALKPETGKSMIAYALSKSLIIKLAELINAEGKGKGIRATVLVPSTIDTESNRKSMPGADHSKWAKPEDIAGSIAFVLSDQGAVLRETILKVYADA